jgi:hypothetical protein
MNRSLERQTVAKDISLPAPALLSVWRAAICIIICEMGAGLTRRVEGRHFLSASDDNCVMDFAQAEGFSHRSLFLSDGVFPVALLRSSHVVLFAMTKHTI